MSDDVHAAADAFAPDDASGLSDAELRALLAQARSTGDVPLRRLLASYLTLRRLAADVVELIEAREGAVTVVRTPLFSRLKHLARRTNG
jgi:hypothetical protein